MVRRACLILSFASACADSSAPLSGTSTGGDGSDTTTSAAESSSSTTAVSSAATADTSSSDGSGSTSGDTTGESVWSWDLPEGFAEPFVPDDNPMSAAKVELGRHLFYDVRMSGGGTFACATCHLQELAFSDGRVTAIGETGDVHRRNSMSLANVGYNASLTWAHPLLVELERQALVPMFGTDPVELGIDSETELVAALEVEPLYAELFAAAFPNDAEPLTAANVVAALSTFQRTIISGRSPYDRWFYGEDDAISEAAKRGYALFNGHPFECFHCHVGFNFSDAVHWQGKPHRDLVFHNTGLYNVDGQGAYPAIDSGLAELTLAPDDMGKFRAPTLRNIALTAPYMHDGSIATLDGVIDHYAAGGRTIAEGEPNAGVGADSPHKDSLIGGFEVTAEQRADIIAFLESLTDTEMLTDPELADPW
ncbi:MAG: di-heme enzyme [Deltaproteobacteria bacterium]|nr:di-heme enzyme [Nannocystaceae bacterium]